MVAPSVAEVIEMLTESMKSPPRGWNVGNSTCVSKGWTAVGPNGKRYWVSITSSSDGRNLAAGEGAAYGSEDPAHIWTSSDYGQTWERTWASDGHCEYVRLASSADGKKLAAAEYVGTIVTSSDFGATWIDRLPEGHEARGRSWRGIASSSDGARLAAAEGSGHIWTLAR